MTDSSVHQFKRCILAATTLIKEINIRLRSSVANVNRAAKIEPFKLLHIDPNEIEYKMPSGETFRRQYSAPQVIDGNWDQNVIPFQQSTTYISILNHFNNGVPWEETTKYEEMLESIREQGEYRGCQSELELKERFDKIDDLYNSIKEEGYKKQADIVDDPMGKPQTTPKNEILVNIGRDGTVIFDQGYHRLSIAKILDIEYVPVRVLVRHKLWQQYRNEVVQNGLGSIPTKHRDHPDLTYLPN